ncbi:MAG: hypothetical protein RLZ62_1943 [Bacteroidota bacterium]|jgi:hypothetical protein
MTRFYILGFWCMFLVGQIKAQSTAYVIGFGPSAGLQKWDNAYNREPLFQYHATLGMESINNEDDRSSFLMQIGYHVRGSAMRFRTVSFISGLPGGAYSERFKFNNISFMMGAKQRGNIGPLANTRYFYFVGLRGDYTYSTNIDELNSQNSCNRALYPLMGGVQRWMAGFSVGGGLEFQFAELVGAQIQLSINPDVTNQYRQGPIPNVIDYCNPGFSYAVPEQRVRNTTVELTVGLRLLRKVILID